jgi:hypothetical protein
VGAVVAAVALVAAITTGFEPAALPPPEVVGGGGPADERSVLVMGDSILLGAVPQVRSVLSASGWDPTVATFPGLPVSVGTLLLTEQKAAGELGPVVVIHLGNNLPTSVAGFVHDVDTMMQVLRDVPFVVWMTIQTFEPSRVLVNAELAAATQRYPNLQLLDWNAAVAANPHWTGGANPHLSGAGRIGMAQLIDARLDEIRHSGARCRAATNPPRAPVSGGRGGWLLDGSGRIHSLGGAPSFGDLATLGAAGRVTPVAVESTPSGEGYWIVTADGAVLAFGDAVFHGGLNRQRLNATVRGLTPAPGGYWLLAGDGGVFAFGAARFLGSMGATRLNGPIVGMAATATGRGYWLVGADGGVFSFGDAPFLGSAGAIPLNAPVVAATGRPAGDGYWLYGQDGGVFAYGRARFAGSLPGLGLCFGPEAVQMRVTASGAGYWVATARDGVFAFGDAPDLGPSAPALTRDAPAVAFAVRP